MTLREKRVLFTKLLAQLIAHMFECGYECSINEVYRDSRVASLNAKSGAGIKKSNHLIGLAADLNLFQNGVYLALTEDHREFGEWWEGLNTLCRWGGRFNDGNHYSLEHEGVK